MLPGFRQVLEHEVFLLGGIRGSVRRWPLEDLFDGLKTAEPHSMRKPSGETPQRERPNMNARKPVMYR